MKQDRNNKHAKCQFNMSQFTGARPDKPEQQQQELINFFSFN